ncbi:MAG: hypothetical protein WA924_17030 [Burkholderiaceae bacterium]
MNQISETSYIVKLKITGMKFNKGTMDNGTAFDSTKVYAETRFDESKGNARGFATTEYNFGKSDEYDKFKHLPIPFIAEAEMENVTNGKTRSIVILQLRPVELAKGAAPARPANAS